MQFCLIVLSLGSYIYNTGHLKRERKQESERERERQHAQSASIISQNEVQNEVNIFCLNCIKNHSRQVKILHGSYFVCSKELCQYKSIVHLLDAVYMNLL